MKKNHIDKLMSGLLIAIALIIVALFVSLITLISGGVKDELLQSDPKDDVGKEAFSSAKLSGTPDYGENYIKSIVFVGDLTVSEMRAFSEYSYAEVWTGENGDLSLDFSTDTATVVYQGESMSISKAAERKKPDYMVITIGLNNGVSYCTEEKFKTYYGKLLESIQSSSPDTKIILQSVFPISKNKEKDSANLSNSKINTANSWILDLCEQYGIRYLDTAEVLKNSDGHLDEKFDSGNGVTLNEAGYSAMLNYIRTHGYK